jgi:hypothetical protein
MGAEQKLAPPQEEGRRVILIAKCSNCNWYSSLPSTTLRMAKDSGLLQDTAKMHEEKYNHQVEFKVG